MANIYDMVDTWNDGVNSRSQLSRWTLPIPPRLSGSLLLDLKVGGVTKASIDKNGNLTATSYSD
jgi:hypothetical protein